MIIKLPQQTYKTYDFRNDRQILNVKRTIFISEIVYSEGNSLVDMQVPPIVDIFYRILSGGSDIESKMSYITVINNSAVKGTIHNRSNSIVRQNTNVYHGVIYDSVDNINAGSIVEFEHYEYSNLVDENCNGTPGDNGICKVFTAGDIYGPYGSYYHQPYIVSGRSVVVPDPSHYDEVDQVKSTDNDEFSYDAIVDDFRNFYTDDVNAPYRTTLGELIDEFTKVYKKKIYYNPRVLSDSESLNVLFGPNPRDYMDEKTILQISCDIQEIMDSNCIHKMTVIFGGDRGFNVTEFKSAYMCDDSVYKLFSINALNSIRCINDSLRGSKYNFNIIVSATDRSSININISSPNVISDERCDIAIPTIDDSYGMLINEY